TGHEFLILSDRAVDRHNAPIPALLAVAGVHHHLIREGTRTKVGLILESGEPREVHHFALLIGYGAGAINPYLAFETIEDMIEQGHIREKDESGRMKAENRTEVSDSSFILHPSSLAEKCIKNYVKAIDKGVLKVMSKMGIS